ncbi:hypothetical protein COB72_10835 [bacterium]|nr:MAG: hypothetical protein COB72_10835 [bacterium]
MASNPSNKDSLNRSPSDPLDRLRGFRVYPLRARGLGEDMNLQMQAMKKISKSESAANEAWATVVPDQIRDCTSVAGLKAGKVVVLVPSAAHRYMVDRWLGSGGLSEFQALAQVPIRGVDLKIVADVGVQVGQNNT